MVLFEDLQNAQVRQTACEASPQGQADAWKARRCRLADCAGLVFALHGTRVPTPLVWTNGPHVPQKQYGCTFPQQGAEALPKCQTVRSY